MAVARRSYIGWREPLRTDLAAVEVRPWRDPVVEAVPGAVATASEEALQWWTPILGPSSALMAHRFAAQVADGPVEWPIDDMARTFGMGQSRRRLESTVARLGQFGIVSCDGTSISVRMMLAPLTRSQRERLPISLAVTYADHLRAADGAL